MFKIDRCIECNRQLYWDSEDQQIVFYQESPDHICKSRYPKEFLEIWGDELAFNLSDIFHIWTNGRIYQDILKGGDGIL